MANILLINLGIIKFSNQEMQYCYNPPLGLMYLSSSLTLHGHNVLIEDYMRIPYTRQHLYHVIKEFSPDLIGFSVYTENVSWAFKICKGIKKYFPDVKISFGGPQASLEPMYCIENKFVDFVLSFEGEASMVELVEAISSNQQTIRYQDITGIYLHDQEGNIIFNKKRRDILDLDLLMLPHRKQKEVDMYGTNVNLITSRGCPGGCIYCSATALSGAKYRMRSEKNAIMEIVYLKNMFGKHLDVVYIADDTFTAIATRVFKFIKLKERLGLQQLQWRCESRVDVFTEEMVKELAESNCVGIALGVESGSQEVLDKIHKKIDLKQVEAVIKYLYRYKIFTSLNFMLGHYCDTRETMEQTYQFIRRLYETYGVDILVSFNTPFPGTWQELHMKVLKIKLLLAEYSEYTVTTPSIEGENFTVEDQLEVYHKMIDILQDNGFGFR